MNSNYIKSIIIKINNRKARSVIRKENRENRDIKKDVKT